MKPILAFGLILTVMLTDYGLSSVSAADGPSDHPSLADLSMTPADILKKAEKQYAGLSSYEDEGMIVSTSNGITTTVAFSMKLERWSHYRVQWTSTTGDSVQKQAVWSAGGGNFLDLEEQIRVPQKNLRTALAAAAEISGGAAATVPGTFFGLEWADQLNNVPGLKRVPDEKLSDFDCYVLVEETNQGKRTLWIGKQDFLIHQLRRTTLLPGKAEGTCSSVAVREAARNDFHGDTQKDGLEHHVFGV